MPKARRTPSPKPDTATLDTETRAAAPGQPTSKPIEPPRAKAPRPSPRPGKPNAKVAALEVNRENADDAPLTTNTGVRIEDDQNSLRAGVRGPSLLEDFHLPRRSPTSTMSDPSASCTPRFRGPWLLPGLRVHGEVPAPGS